VSIKLKTDKINSLNVCTEWREENIETSTEINNIGAERQQKKHHKKTSRQWKDRRKRGDN
jgi:hypothetical protein